MAKKQARGTKRTCQSSECGARFYDLDRDPIVCPICGSIYEIASSPRLAEALAEDKPQRKPKKAVVEDELEVADDAEATDIEADETIEAADDETFLEEEEEEGDVSNIIGGVGDEEET